MLMTPQEVQRDREALLERKKKEPKLKVNPDRRLPHTVPLPYQVGGKDFSDQELRDYDDECLIAIEHKLRWAVCTGKPYKALFMEYVLSANGGELSEYFLSKLALILIKYKVACVVDEVLTGGGRAGLSMTMTTALPIAFQRVVDLITLGKWFGRALVLRRIPNGVQSVDANPRGYSTHAPEGEICKTWKTVHQRILERLPEERRKDLEIKLGINDNELSWGRYLLFFSHKGRKCTHQSLKCRDLPMLEKTIIRTGPREATDWTRSKLTGRLMEVVRIWIAYIFHRQEKEDIVLAELLLYTDRSKPHAGDERLLFRAEEFAESLKKIPGRCHQVLSGGQKKAGKWNAKGKSKKQLPGLTNATARALEESWNKHFAEDEECHNAFCSEARVGSKRLSCIGVETSFFITKPIIVDASFADSL